MFCGELRKNSSKQMKILEEWWGGGKIFGHCSLEERSDLGPDCLQK